MRFRLPLLVLLTCLLGVPVAGATVAGLIPAVVPVQAGESPDLELVRVHYLTWFATPEAGIGAVTWPYRVNSPHDDWDGRNVNLASMVGLVVATDYRPSGVSTVTIDVGAMTELPDTVAAPGDLPPSKLELLRAVIDATERNVRTYIPEGAHLVVTGLSEQPELATERYPHWLGPPRPLTYER